MLLRPAFAREQSYCTFSPHLPTTDACLGGHPFTGASRLMPSSRRTAGDHGLSLIRRHSLDAVSGGQAAFSERPRREGSRLPGVLDARLPPERFSPTNRAGVAAKALYRLDWTREYPPDGAFPHLRLSASLAMRLSLSVSYSEVARISSAADGNFLGHPSSPTPELTLVRRPSWSDPITQLQHHLKPSRPPSVVLWAFAF
jgi:hypothetical protein